MYEAMSTRAPDSTKLAGASVTVLVLALTAYALSTGLGVQIVKAITPPMVVVNLPDVAETPEPVERFAPDTKTSLAAPVPPTPRFWFETDDDPPIKVGLGPDMIGPVGPGAGAGVGPVGPRIAPTKPKLLKADQPPYPSADVRARNEGVSGLELCVDAKGRVTAAKLVSSSGHARLDDAAVKWVRTARFTPATREGAPEAVCGHAIDYEWKVTVITPR